MTETKRCCGKCISIYAGSVGCRLRLECPCHTTNMSPPCVCGNRGYSALMNNEHFPGCPCHVPVSEPLKYNTWIQHDNGKPTPTPPPTEWEIRFNERFMTIFSLHTGADTFKPVKDFIRTLLAEQKARMVEVVEGMKINDEDYFIQDPSVAYNEGYDKACSDIIKALSK